MNPTVKKILSGVLVAAAMAILGVLQEYTKLLSPQLSVIAVSVISGAVHYLNTLGHAERVEQIKAAAVEQTVEAMSQPVTATPINL